MKTKFVSKSVFAAYSMFALFIIYGCMLHLHVLYLAAFFAALAVFMRFYAKRGLKPLVFTSFLIAVTFLLKLCFVLAVDTQPISDFELLYGAAQSAASGDYSIIHTSPYFQNWAYQTANVIWMSFFVKLFGAGVTFFKVLNCLYLTGANVLVYLFARRCASERSAQIAGVIYMLYPGVYFMAPVLTNQHLCNLLIFAGLFLYTRRRPLSYHRTILTAAISGFLISLGNAVRPVGIVVIAAAVFTELVMAFKERKAQGLFKRALALGVMLASFLALSVTLSAAVKASGINEHGLSNNFPIWKFVVGFNFETSGLYSAKDDREIFQIRDPNERQIKAEAVLKERLSASPRRYVTLFSKKIELMWANRDTTQWAFGHLLKSKRAVLPLIGAADANTLLSFAQKISSAFYSGVFILSLFFSVSLVKNGCTRYAALVLCVVFAVYFGVHLLIEVQNRYRDFALIPVFALSAGGIDMFTRVLYRKHGKRITSSNIIRYLFKKTR